MKTAIEKKYYLIPILYVCVIGVFLYFHFSDNRTFTKQIGFMEISGTVPGGIGGENNAVTTIRISCGNFEFFFHERETIFLQNTNGTTEPALLQAYTVLPNGIELRFSNSIRLQFMSEEGKNKLLTIQPQTQSSQSALNSLILPFSVSGESEIKEAGKLPLIALSDDGETTYLTVNSDSTIDVERKEIRITHEEGTFHPITIEPASDPSIDIATYWFSQNLNRVDNETLYNQILEDYFTDSYRGWNERYSAAAGEWETPNGESVFSEHLIACYLSSALKEGEYDRALAQIRSGINRRASELTMFTVPYLGNFAQRGTTLADKDIGRIDTIEQLIRNEDPKLFTQEYLIQFIIDHGPFSLINEVYRLAEIIEPENLSTEEMVGVLRTHNQLSFNIPDTDPIISNLAESIQSRLLSSIIKTEDSLFLKNKTGTIDPFISLEAGRQLLHKAKEEENNIIAAVGRELVISVLQLSDDQGFLPSEITVENGRQTIANRTVPPEKIYPLSLRNSFYPREISLYEHVGPGSWIWSCTDFEEIAESAEELHFSFEFPVGQTHHFIIQGIKPFEGIRLHGIPWRSDPTFERYSSGWIYNSSNQTLSVKITHREEQEQLIITY